MYCKLTHQLGQPIRGLIPQVNGVVVIQDEMNIEPVVNDGLELESGFEVVIVDGLEGGAGGGDFIPDAIIVDVQGVDEDSEVEFNFDVAECCGVGANVVVGVKKTNVENILSANLVIPAIPPPPVGNGRPLRAGLSVRNYNENNRDLDDEIGAESPIIRKLGSKRHCQL
jgi:hypothetical protein